MKKLKVSMMPSDVRNACLERGCTLETQLTPQEALGHYAAWEIGDDTWALIMINRLDTMRALAE